MRTLLRVVSLCCSLLLLAACGTTNEPKPTMLTVSVTAAKLAPVNDVVELTGTVSPEPNHSAHITSPLQGVLSYVGPRVGDPVTAGEVVARLQDSIQAAQQQQNEGNLSLALANLAKAQHGSRPQEIEQARANVDSSKANLVNATKNRKRLQKLEQEEVIAGKDYDLAIDQERVAQAQLKSAEEALSLALKGPRMEDKAAAAAQAKQAAGVLAQSKANLDFTRLRSPITGVVAERYLDVGEQAGPTTPVMLVVDPTVVNIQLNLPVGVSNKVFTGQPVEVMLPDSAAVIMGAVNRIGMKLDPVTNTIPVQVLATNLNLALKFGMVIKARIITDTHQAIVIPKQALIGSASDPNKRVVNVVVNGETKSTPVQVGTTSDGVVEAKSGIKPGDLVITTVGYELPDGTRVAVR